MTEQECLDFIETGVPASDATNKEVIAKRCLLKAITKFGRMKNVDWNRRSEIVTLTASKQSYNVGQEILGDSNDGWDIPEIWLNDRRSWPVQMVSMNDFNPWARGSTTAGRPQIATFHSDERILEFYPIPDSNYDIWIYFRKNVKNFAEIPSIYHDALCDFALLCVKAIFDNRIALQLASQSFKDVVDDSLTMWHGNNIRMADPFSMRPKSGNSFASSDSGNLRRNF